MRHNYYSDLDTVADFVDQGVPLTCDTFPLIVRALRLRAAARWLRSERPGGIGRDRRDLAYSFERDAEHLLWEAENYYTARPVPVSAPH